MVTELGVHFAIILRRTEGETSRIHTHYDNLKVSRDAPIEVILAAYKTLAAKHHPDHHSGSEKAARTMRIINASYEVLRDPEKRLQHDRWIASKESNTSNTEPRSHEADDSAEQTAGSGIERFVKLCHSIRLNCWQNIHEDQASRERNNEALKCAYRIYGSQAKPWLSAMIEAHGINAEVLAPARDAAARCLFSIAGGLLRVNNLGDAEKLANEALVLARHDPGLEGEIIQHLNVIRSDRARATQPSPSRPRKSFWLTPAAICLPFLVIATIFVVANYDSKTIEPAKPKEIHTGGDHDRRVPLPFDPDAMVAKYGGGSNRTASLPQQQVFTAVPAPVLKAVPVPRPEDPIAGMAPVPKTPASAIADVCETSIEDLKQTRPANGEEAGFTGAGEGLGLLEIINGNSQDAAIILADLAGVRGDRLMYVRSGMQATMRGISPGQYRIMFQTGKNWDPSAESFQCVSGTEVFEKIESFTEEKRADGIEYSRVQIRLHKVIGGNARSDPIARQAFVRRGTFRLSPPEMSPHVKIQAVVWRVAKECTKGAAIAD